MLPDFVVQLLNKHVRSTIYCVFNDNGKIAMKSGVLDTVLSDKLIMKSEVDNSQVIVPFFINNELALLNAYNANFIDLMRGKRTFSLDDKLKVKEIKSQIISNLRPYMGKEISIIYKAQDKLMMNRGQFSNMGMMGVLIKLAPFYNTEENIYYKNILHIYNSELSDVLNVKLNG